MKFKFKIGLFSGLFFCSLFITSCPRKPPASDIGFSCQRLSNCTQLYGSQLIDPEVKKLVEYAQKSRDENKCSTAILQFSTAVKQDCPF